MTKQNRGNYFEDFAVGQTLIHATPRTITQADATLYTALYGSRFAVQSAETFATAIGYPRAPLDDMLVFHIVFGKTVPDISLNAVANLGYAECRFLEPVYPGDTMTVTSDVIGVKQNSNGKTGVVYVRTTGTNQHDRPVLTYVRWVMVRKASETSPAPETIVPDLDASVPAPTADATLAALNVKHWSNALAGSPHRWTEYAVGEKIDHIDGMTIEESEHQLATRLYQNTAKVHFNQHTEGEGRFGKRLVYGGHIISMARALAFNGFGNAFHIAAINAGQHVAPCFAGDTIYAWSEILAAAPLEGNEDFGVLRIRTVGLKNQAANDFPDKGEDGRPDPSVVLNLDYWAVMPG